jgi:hypothetical protein
VYGQNSAAYCDPFGLRPPTELWHRFAHLPSIMYCSDREQTNAGVDCGPLVLLFGLECLEAMESDGGGGGAAKHPCFSLENGRTRAELMRDE